MQIDLAEARRRLRNKKTRRLRERQQACQAVGTVICRARSRHRFDELVHASREGLSRAEAAERAGLTEDSARRLIRRRLGYTAWPIPAEDNHA